MWLYEAWEQNVEWSGVGDGVEWSGVETRQTVMTTRAPVVVLINQFIAKLNDVLKKHVAQATERAFLQLLSLHCFHSFIEYRILERRLFCA